MCVSGGAPSAYRSRIYPARRRVVEQMRGKVKTLGRRRDVQRAQRKSHAETGTALARGRRICWLTPLEPTNGGLSDEKV
ncbi:hypothetical protein EMIT0111MI5_170038 [Burkholderia sp. IT-111MI5]